MFAKATIKKCLCLIPTKMVSIKLSFHTGSSPPCPGSLLYYTQMVSIQNHEANDSILGFGWKLFLSFRFSARS
jgi:hypothetical protein